MDQNYRQMEILSPWPIPPALRTTLNSALLVLRCADAGGSGALTDPTGSALYGIYQGGGAFLAGSTTINDDGF
jgi:hypothetical protein